MELAWIGNELHDQADCVTQDVVTVHAAAAIVLGIGFWNHHLVPFGGASIGGAAVAHGWLYR